MKRNISASKFPGIRVEVSHSMLDRYGKKLLILQTIDARKEFVIAPKWILAVAYIVVEHLALYFIWCIACICSEIMKERFPKAEIVPGSSILE